MSCTRTTSIVSLLASALLLTSAFAGYGKVMIDPIDVAFRKDWDPTKAGSRMKLTTEERENIQTGVAKIVYDEFVKELQANSTYQVVPAAGPDVLRVKASIINLYVNAPDTMTASRSRTYTVSAGEMTLTSSVVNASEGRTIASSWARILRSRLDAAHGSGKK